MSLHVKWISCENVHAHDFLKIPDFPFYVIFKLTPTVQHNNERFRFFMFFLATETEGNISSIPSAKNVRASGQK